MKLKFSNLPVNAGAEKNFVYYFAYHQVIRLKNSLANLARYGYYMIKIVCSQPRTISEVLSNIDDVLTT